MEASRLNLIDFRLYCFRGDWCVQVRLELFIGTNGLEAAS